MVKAATWVVPVVAVALAAPAAAASTTNVGAYQLVGVCDITTGLPKLVLSADALHPLPAGTVVSIKSQPGTISLDSVEVAEGTVSVIRLNQFEIDLILTSPLTAGRSLEFRPTARPPEYYSLAAFAPVPPTAVGVGSKTNAFMTKAQTECYAS